MSLGAFYAIPRAANITYTLGFQNIIKRFCCKDRKYITNYHFDRIGLYFIN